MSAKGYFLFFVIGQFMIILITEIIYQSSLDLLATQGPINLGSSLMSRLEPNIALMYDSESLHHTIGMIKMLYTGKIKIKYENK